MPAPANTLENVVKGVETATSGAVAAVPEATERAQTISGALDQALKDKTPPHDLLEMVAGEQLNPDTIAALQQSHQQKIPTGPVPNANLAPSASEAQSPKGTADGSASEQADPSAGTPQETPQDQTQTADDKTDNKEEQPNDEKKSEEAAADAGDSSAKAEEEEEPKDMSMAAVLARARTSLEGVNRLRILVTDAPLAPESLYSFFEKMKTELDLTREELMLVSADLVKEENHRYAEQLQQLKGMCTVLRREAADLYREKFKLEPDLSDAIPLGPMDKMRNKVRKAIHTRLKGDNTDTLFTLTEEDQAQIRELYDDMKKHKTLHRKDQMTEVGMMALLMAMQQVEQAAQQQGAAASHH